MSAVVFNFAATTRKCEARPWQNHELAEFYRAIDLLARAGLHVVAEMGVSDEGDPWFAFCRSDTGDVVVHCARIEGVCVATSIATSDVFRGKDFREVINAIIRQREFALATPPSATERIYLHPAAVFTAFIAAALLFLNQASAHDLHSDGSATASDTPIVLTKIFASLRKMVSETVRWDSASAAAANQIVMGQAYAEPISLAVVISAAMTVLTPIIQGSDLLVSVDATVAPASHPDTVFNPYVTSVSAPFEFSVQSAPILQQSVPLAGSDTFSEWPKANDLTAASAKLLVPVLHTDITIQASSGLLTFSAASDSSLASHAAAATLHVEPQAVPIASETSASSVQQPLPSTQTGNVGSSASDASSSAPHQPLLSAHLADLNELTSTALAVFFGSVSPPTPLSAAGAVVLPLSSSGAASHGSDLSMSSPSTDVAPASVNLAPATGSSETSIATPTTIVFAANANPTIAFAQLTNYALGTHPINAAPTVSSALAAELHGVAQPVQLVVFDSSAVTLPFFEYAPGVFFVDDHALGLSPSQASQSNLVTVDLATGGTMQLLGVVSTAHLTS